MFARRPRFDDTFGVRMDLGADRMDPMSLRPSHQAGQLRVKAPVLVEDTRSIFGPRRHPEPLAELGERPERQSAPIPANTDFRERNLPASGDGLRRVESLVLGGWRKMSVQHRITAGVIGGWILLGTGLFIPAIVIAGIYIVMRNRAS